MRSKQISNQGWKYLSLITAFFAVTLQAFTYDFLVDGIYYDITNSTTKEVAVTCKLFQKGGRYSSDQIISDYAGDVVVPSKVSYEGVTYSVTAISDYAFDDSDVESIKLPNSIKSIGNSAFAYCTLLTDIEIPESVNSVGSFVFMESGIGKVITSKSILYYCPNTYEGEYHIPMGITQLAAGAFSGCNKLTKVIIPHGVAEIAQSTFSNCM